MAKSYRSDHGPSQRQLRVGELLRHALVEILQHIELRDPDLEGVSVTIAEVRPSPDISSATVFCSPLGGQDVDKVVAGLNRCSSFLRGQLSSSVEMRHTPTLKFIEDRSFRDGEAIDQLLQSERVARDLDSGAREE